MAKLKTLLTRSGMIFTVCISAGVMSAGSALQARGAVDLPGRIEAENYSAMSGVKLEASNDDITQSVGWVNRGDWMDYKINVPEAGDYSIRLRVASTRDYRGMIQLKVGGQVLSTVGVPNTGGWYNWVTLTTTVKLNAGPQTLRVYARGGWFNLNWMDFTKGSGGATTDSKTRDMNNNTSTGGASSKDVKDLKEKYEDLNKKHEELNEKYDNTNQKYDELNKKNEDLKKDHDNLKMKHNELNEKHEKLDEEFKSKKCLF